jgi:hypothetical protein
MAVMGKKAIKQHPARAIQVCHHITMMCDFIENPTIQKAINDAIPVCMPPLVGSLGFDVPLWVGLGTVRLWAALDAFEERANPNNNYECSICEIKCIP